MKNKEVVQSALQRFHGEASLEQIYEFALSRKTEWENFNPDYQHTIRSLLHAYMRVGKIGRTAPGRYKLLSPL